MHKYPEGNRTGGGRGRVPSALMSIKMAHLGHIKAFFEARQLNEPRADVTVLSHSPFCAFLGCLLIRITFGGQFSNYVTAQTEHHHHLRRKLPLATRSMTASWSVARKVVAFLKNLAYVE